MPYLIGQRVENSNSKLKKVINNRSPQVTTQASFSGTKHIDFAIPRTAIGVGPRYNPVPLIGTPRFGGIIL